MRGRVIFNSGQLHAAQSLLKDMLLASAVLSMPAPIMAVMSEDISGFVTYGRGGNSNK